MTDAIAVPSKFDQLEAAIAQLPPGDAPITHHFSKGLYAREMFLPEGTVLTGKIHRHECLNVVFGDITVFNAETGEKRRITGFDFFKSPAGTRRAGYAHADTRWITFHPTEETDLEKIEAEVIEPYENPLLKQGDQKLEL